MRSKTVLLPPHIKRALDLVAADQDTTASDLLRDCAVDIVTEYNGGFFLKYALDNEQNATEANE